MRESIRKDRARIQIGRISQFWIARDDTPKIKRGIYKMGNSTFFRVHFLKKFLKKIQHLAFTEKVKIIKIFIPEKVKIYIKVIFLIEIKYFQKKYSIKIEIISDEKLIIPEYKIELLNKTKKLLNEFEK